MKNRNIQFKPTLGLLISVLLVCFALPPGAKAVVPPPDGGYPGNNTAEGQDALLSLPLPVDGGGHGNTAVGWSSLKSNTGGSRNTAIGLGTLYFNTTGQNNTANGELALFNNTTGGSNTATGERALVNNTTGSFNTASGREALESNTTGRGNSAVGLGALSNNETGELNTAIGHLAGRNITGSHNICIGDNVVGVAGENNTTRIRNIYPSMASARAVYVNSDNKLGTLMSSRRFKDEIKPMDKVSEAILALKPVTFRYKKEIETNGAMMFGLIAEEVEKVAPELVTRNDKGEVETVRYDAVNAMLLNEFLKEHRKNEKQEATIAQLKSTVAKQEATIAQQQTGLEMVTARLNAQAAQIQKVSAQIELQKPPAQAVVNNQ